MENLSAFQTSRLDLQIVQEEDDSVSATIALKNTDDEAFEFTQPFVDGVANFQSETGITSLPLGTYAYMIYENFSTGLPIAYPDPDNCEGDCELPTITICEAIEVS